jgi:hypothetical protein
MLLSSAKKYLKKQVLVDDAYNGDTVKLRGSP